MPDWQLYTQSGEKLEYQKLQGKPLLLHFWATWCPYCKKLQPGLERLRQKYQSQGLQVIGISFNEDQGVKPQDTLSNRGINFVTAVDGDQLAREMGVMGTPTTYFVYADGTILTVTNTSNPNDPLLERAVLALLNKPVPESAN
ncbi:MAG: TlpA family protein disulfide reductase [Aestuariibacter sp.]